MLLNHTKKGNKQPTKLTESTIKIVAYSNKLPEIQNLKVTKIGLLRVHSTNGRRI